MLSIVSTPIGPFDSLRSLRTYCNIYIFIKR